MDTYLGNEDRLPEDWKELIGRTTIAEESRRLQRNITSVKNLRDIFETWPELSAEYKELIELQNNMSSMKVNQLYASLSKYERIVPVSDYVINMLNLKLFQR